MGQDRTFRYYLYYAFLVAEWTAGISVVLLTLLVSQDAGNYQTWPLPTLIGWTHNHKVLIFVISAIAVVAKFVRARIGPPWAWKAIKELLDTWHSKIFAGIPNASADEHRITVFKRVHGWRPIRSWRELEIRTGRSDWWRYSQWPVGWFKPLARSQHVSQRNITWFPCFDATRIGEGFIGLVWRTSGTLRIPIPPQDLPDLNPPPPNKPSDADYLDYAKRTRVTEAWLRTRGAKTYARTLCGTKIEIKGTKWGVIVIDSRSTALTVMDDQVEFAAAALGKFIERA